MQRITPDVTVSKYRVNAGDTLASIAMRMTGKADYTAIYEQNKIMIGDNPNNISPGMILTIPGISGEDTKW